jgi:hypothetical protein
VLDLGDFKADQLLTRFYMGAAAWNWGEISNPDGPLAIGIASNPKMRIFVYQCIDGLLDLF